jgi:response regulator NasT
MSIVSERVRADQGIPAPSGASGSTPVHIDPTTAIPRRVIVASRDARSSKEVTLALIDEGFDVVGQATDGHQLSALAGALGPDLIIIDIDDPVSGGLAAGAQELARLAPVVLLGSELGRDLSPIVEAGVMAVVRKPCSRANLIPAIEMAAARFAEAATLRADVAQLSQRLDTRKIVDRAKGILMDRRGMTEPEAYRWMQRTAMDRRTSMRRVAEATIGELSESSTIPQ